MKCLPILTFVILFFCPNLRGGNILNVPSVENPTIQSAINNCFNGDTIIVQPGAYRENINFSGKAVTLKSADPNDPNIVAATIIDGNQPADVNKGSVVTFNSGEKNNSVLTGFTITGGSGSWILVSWQYKGPNWNRCGGGAVCYNISEPTIKNNIFRDNFAGMGGGIYIYGDPVNPNSPTDPPVHVRPVITNNRFIRNHSEMYHSFLPPNNNYPANDHGDGGAIVGFQGCDAVITDNIIEDNYAYFYGGAMHLRQWSNGLIQKNKILNNSSNLGGGLHITYSSSPVVTENTIQQNIARGLGGGGIYVYFNSNPVISNNVIIKNIAAGNGKGGGIGIFWDSKPTVEFNLIAKNSAFLGGGIYSNAGPVKFSYNTIAGNSAVYQGDGICLEFWADVNAVGNIVAANTGSYQIYGTGSISLAASFNDVWSTDGNDFGGSLTDMNGISGNISKDPLFTSPDSNDFSLTIKSPCINAGDPNFIAKPNQMDINGDDRVIGSVIDIGADEVVLNPLDLNKDGIINCYELQILAEEWLQERENLQTDFHKNNRIDFLDFAELANQWLRTAPWQN